MNLAILHSMQKSYVVIGARFFNKEATESKFDDLSSKLYYYKAEQAENWIVGSYAVVRVAGRKHPQLVLVEEVVEDPLSVLDPNIPYSWAISKVDEAISSARMASQTAMISKLRQLDARRQAESVVKEYRERLGIVDGSEALTQLEMLGAPPVVVKNGEAYV